MKPGGGGKPYENLGRRINKAFGSYELFRKEFTEKAMTLGSGWISLVLSNGSLLVVKTDYHNSPILKGQKMLLTLDVWEHAYYLDYLDEKEKYVDAFLDHLINWDNAEARLKMFEG
jgi:Fe-Mn family superoxide dismutase